MAARQPFGHARFEQLAETGAVGHTGQAVGEQLAAEVCFGADQCGAIDQTEQRAGAAIVVGVERAHRDLIDAALETALFPHQCGVAGAARKHVAAGIVEQRRRGIGGPVPQLAGEAAVGVESVEPFASEGDDGGGVRQRLQPVGRGRAGGQGN